MYAVRKGGFLAHVQEFESHGLKPSEGSSAAAPPIAKESPFPAMAQTSSQGGFGGFGRTPHFRGQEVNC